MQLLAPGAAQAGSLHSAIKRKTEKKKTEVSQEFTHILLELSR